MFCADFVEFPDIGVGKGSVCSHFPHLYTVNYSGSCHSDSCSQTWWISTMVMKITIAESNPGMRLWLTGLKAPTN